MLHTLSGKNHITQPRQHGSDKDVSGDSGVHPGPETDLLMYVEWKRDKSRNVVKLSEVKCIGLPLPGNTIEMKCGKRRKDIWKATIIDTEEIYDDDCSDDEAPSTSSYIEKEEESPRANSTQQGL